jgi:hypothetical protein
VDVIGPCSFSYIAVTWQNGRDQQIAANGLSTPQDAIAILLQGLVMAFRLPGLRQLGA